MIKKYLQKLRKNSFVMQVATLMSGTALSQGILFAATPLITRLYTPEEFGIFSLYLAIIGPISMVSSWRYEVAIMLPEDNEDAKALLVLSVLITIFMSILTFLLIIIFEDAILLHLTDSIGLFLWLVPFGVFISGLIQILTAWNTRNEQYGNIAQSKVLRSSVTASIQIGAKTSFPLTGGLIWGSFIGAIVASCLLLYKAIKQHTLRLNELSYDRIKKNAKEHDKFPKYQSFATFVNSMSQSIPIIFLSFFYAPEIAGYYALANRVLLAPVALISGSVRNVYYQKASKKHSLNESIKSLYVKTTLNLLKMSFIPFLIVAIFAEPLFVYLFGDKWVISAIFVQILFIRTIIAFINPAASGTVFILGLQRFALVFSVTSAFLIILALFAGYIFFDNYYMSLAFLAFTASALTLYFMFFLYAQINKNDARIIKDNHALTNNTTNGEK
ncbi:MAG: hypothetical protein COB07_11680 [Sulfurovum sp.]|nr:MAG: hypothetical protein COB07_11680 [Sulfurovum sp.]